MRPSNKHLTAQVIEAKPEGDNVLASAHSMELKEFGWKGPCGNMPAAYLTGLLAGHRAKASGISEAILDIGRHYKGHGSRIFAAAKGALDAGLLIPHEKSALPDMDRVKGKNIANYAQLLVSKPESYKRSFAGYLKQKIKPESLEKHFSEVEEKISGLPAEARK